MSPFSFLNNYKLYWRLNPFKKKNTLKQILIETSQTFATKQTHQDTRWRLERFQRKPNTKTFIDIMIWMRIERSFDIALKTISQGEKLTLSKL